MSYNAVPERTFNLTWGLPARYVQSGEPAKFVRPSALWWEDAELSSCSLAMIKVRLVLKEKLFNFIPLSYILFIPDGSFILICSSFTAWDSRQGTGPRRGGKGLKVEGPALCPHFSNVVDGGNKEIWSPVVGSNQYCLFIISCQHIP